MCTCSMVHLGETAEGREEIVKAMHLCGNASTTLPDRDAVLGLEDNVIGSFQGLAQVGFGVLLGHCISTAQLC